MMSSMRGGFRRAVKGATGQGEPARKSPVRRFVWNAVTIALVAGAAYLLARRFGLLR
jgi:hypothetical protein